MAENLGISEASCPSELSNEATLTNGERLTNQQLELFSHFSSLTGKENVSNTSEAVDDESDNEDDHQGIFVESAFKDHGVVELKQEPIDSGSSDCENSLTVEFFNKSLPPFYLPIPDYNPPDDYASSTESAIGLMRTDYNDTDDKEWTVSDEQSTEDEEFEVASGPDDKCPDPDYDNSDDESEDSDYKPSKSSRRKSKSSATGRGRGRGRGVRKKYKRDSYQDKINRLKKSIAETDYMKVVPSSSSDVSYLQRLLAKGQTELTKNLLAKKCQGNNKNLDVSQETQDDMRRAVEEVLKKRNLMPRSFGPEVSHAAITSYANILCRKNSKEDSKSLDEPQSVASQSASQLLQSLSQSITCKEQTQGENIPNVPAIIKTQDKMEGLSGRSSVLLQHLLFKDIHKKRIIDQVTPSSSSILASTQELQSAGISVLRSMLTTGIPIIQREPSQRKIPAVKATLLRNLLEAAPAPLLPQYRNSISVAEMDDSEDDRSADLENEEPESFGGYTVYVDNAVTEEDSKDSTASEQQDSPIVSQGTSASLEHVTIKTEPLAEQSSVQSENCEVGNSQMMLNIKSEPHSPCAESSKEMSSSEGVQPEKDVQQDNVVKIKQEPRSPTSLRLDDGIDNEVKRNTESQYSSCGSAISGSDLDQLDSQQSQGSPDESKSSKEMSSSVGVQPEKDVQQDNVVKIKQEPRSPTSLSYDDWIDNEVNRNTESQYRSYGSAISGSDLDQLDSQQSHGSPDESKSVQIKSEPLSPTAGEKDLSKGDSSFIHQNVTDKNMKVTSSLKRLPESNLRTLLVDNDSAASSSFWNEGREEDTHSKPGRPCTQKTLSHKINHLKRGMISSRPGCFAGEHVSSVLDKSASAHLKSLSKSGESVGSGLDKSASAHLQSLSRSSSRDTILRGLMDGSSTSVLGLNSIPDEGHSYNTRRKKKQEDTSLLEKALKLFKPVLPSVRNRPMDQYQKEPSPVRIVPVRQSGLMPQTGHTLNTALQDPVEADSTDSNRGLPFTQNASCSQQLLNIIKNVGASQKTGDSKEKSVTILKTMLNDDNVGRASVTDSVNIPYSDPDEPRAKFPRLADSFEALSPGNSNSSPPNLISRRSGTFLSQSQESRSSPGVPHSYTETVGGGASIFSPLSRSASSSKMLGLSGRSDNLSSPANNQSSGRHLVTDCPYQCRLCGSTFSSTSLLEEHMQVHFGSLPFGCSLCPKSFMTGKDLEEHMKVHMGNLSPALVYKCTVCGAVFDTEMQHDQHRILHMVSLKTKFKCSVCDRLFASEEVRDAHLKTHQYKAKTCEICGLQFRSESKYNLHKSVMHKSQGHPCEYCGEVFYSQSKYIRHLSQHTGLKEFNCEKCDKGFVSKNGVMGHKAKCQGRAYVCTGCEESFIRKMDLTSHIADVHGHPGVRCEYCHKVFCYRTQLEEHQKEHEKELQQETNYPQSCFEISSRDDSDSLGTNQKELEADLQQSQQEAESLQSPYEEYTRDDSDSLGTQNSITYSVQRSAGPAGVSEFSVQCLAEPSDDFEVVAISDSD